MARDPDPAGEETFLQRLSRDLTQVAVLLAGYAEGDARRGTIEGARPKRTSTGLGVRRWVFMPQR